MKFIACKDLRKSFFDFPLFFVYCGAIIDIGTDISVPMEMIGIVAKIGTILKGLER